MKNSDLPTKRKPKVCSYFTRLTGLTPIPAPDAITPDELSKIIGSPDVRSSSIVAEKPCLSRTLSSAIWFAMHVIFGVVVQWCAGHLILDFPRPYSVDWAVLILTGLALLAMCGLKLGIGNALTAGAEAAMLASLVA